MKDTATIEISTTANDTYQTLQKKVSETVGLFKIKTATDWLLEAEGLEDPQALFDSFWQEGEVCILFADTNTGKSALAVQIADSITAGKPIKGFSLGADPQPVVYFDFELSTKQFSLRYSGEGGKHNFSDMFYRCEIDQHSILEFNENTRFEDYLVQSVEQVIVGRKCRVVIVDNITFLKHQTEKSAYALPLMKYLIKLKLKYDLSLLVLAHTPKRDMYKELSRNDLQGSKMLINFCDSAFCIGENHQDKRIRYLKQIKSRSAEVLYDSDNVAIGQLVKPDNFLKFEFIGFGAEREHLKRLTDDERSERVEQAKALKEEGFNNCEIARKFSVSEGAVRKWLK